MKIWDNESILEAVRADGAEDWQAVADALEDGEYLASIGVTDDYQVYVESAHRWATDMARQHPEYKF